MDPSYALGLRQHEIKVYRWGFPYLDYSFDVLVSWSRDLNLYDRFCLLLPFLLVLDFTSDFLFYDYYAIPVHILPSTCILFRLFPVLIWLYYKSSLLAINCCISTCSCLLHVYDLELPLHMCLSWLATWLLHHHSPGSSDSSGSSCPGFEAWSMTELGA